MVGKVDALTHSSSDISDPRPLAAFVDEKRRSEVHRRPRSPGSLTTAPLGALPVALRCVVRDDEDHDRGLAHGRIEFSDLDEDILVPFEDRGGPPPRPAASPACLPPC